MAQSKSRLNSNQESVTKLKNVCLQLKLSHTGGKVSAEKSVKLLVRHFKKLSAVTAVIISLTKYWLQRL